MATDVVAPTAHEISVVVPVYAGATTLPPLLDEILALASGFTTKDGNVGRVSEVLLVYDHGPDSSDQTIRELAFAHEIVRPVWLSRNFGQHAATLAGMSSSGGDWVVTMDEDGQHDPADIPAMLDSAMGARADVVYARPTNRRPHGALRNLASRAGKWLIDALVPGGHAVEFQSYRLVLGELARSVAAYAGAGVYLDVALSWVSSNVTTCPAAMRNDQRPSGYRLRTLLSHFWRLAITSGTRLLRLVSLLGALLAFLGVLAAISIVVIQLLGGVDVPGWTSVMVALLALTGAILFSLGVIAEYLGVAVNMALGKPLYLITSDPRLGPLGRIRPHD